MDTSNLSFLGLPMLLWVPLLPLLGATLNLVLGRYWSKATTHTIAVAAVIAACGVAIFLVFFALFHPVNIGTVDAPSYVPQWQAGGLEQAVYTWIEIGSFKAQLAFRLDT